MENGILLVIGTKKKVMKKMLAGIVILSSLVLSASAQNGGGGGADRMAQYRQMLKDSLQLTDVQCDSVQAVQQDLRPQMRAIFQDQSLSQDDKTAKMKDLNAQAAARYAKFLSPDQVTKLQAMQDRMRARMRQRQGGGNR